jgi:hypothetical protein
MLDLAGNFLADLDHTGGVLLRLNRNPAHGQVFGQRRTTRMLLAFFTLVGDFLFFNFHCSSAERSRSTCVRGSTELAECGLLKKLHLFRRGRRYKAFGFGSKDQSPELIQLVLEGIDLPVFFLAIAASYSALETVASICLKNEKTSYFKQPFDIGCSV